MLTETFLPVEICAGNEFYVCQNPLAGCGDGIKHIKLIDRALCSIDEDMLNKLAEQHKKGFAFLVNENNEVLAEHVVLYHISGYPADESIPILAPILVYNGRPLSSKNWTVYARATTGAQSRINRGPVIKVRYKDSPEMPHPEWYFQYIWIRTDFDQHEWFRIDRVTK